jgi:hypothetical protein
VCRHRPFAILALCPFGVKPLDADGNGLLVKGSPAEMAATIVF